MLISKLNSERLQIKLKNILEISNPQRKGRAFEKLMLQVIRYSGIKAESTSRLTKFGEQIDILANWERNIIAECKIHKEKKKICIQDIQAFIGRLSFREPNVMGLYISWSEFSKPSIDQISRNQNRIIIILNQAEIENVIKGVLDLEILLREKELSSLRGVVQRGYWVNKNTLKDKNTELIWKSDYVGNSSFDPQEEVTRLSSLGNNKELSWISRGELLHVSKVTIFTRSREKPIRYWARFYLPTPKEKRQFWELGHILKVIRAYEQIFGFSDHISLNVGQNGIQWHYIGINRVFDEFFHPKNRYSDLSESEYEKCHYRESLALVDDNLDDIMLIILLDTYKTKDKGIYFRNYSIALGSNEILYGDKRIEKLNTLIGGTLTFLENPLEWLNLSEIPENHRNLKIYNSLTENENDDTFGAFYTKLLIDNPWWLSHQKFHFLKEPKLLVQTTFPIGEELPSELNLSDLKVCQFAYLPCQISPEPEIVFVDITYLI